MDRLKKGRKRAWKEEKKETTTKKVTNRNIETPFKGLEINKCFTLHSHCSKKALALKLDGNLEIDAHV